MFFPKMFFPKVIFMLFFLIGICNSKYYNITKNYNTTNIAEFYNENTLEITNNNFFSENVGIIEGNVTLITLDKKCLSGVIHDKSNDDIFIIKDIPEKIITGTYVKWMISNYDNTDNIWYSEYITNYDTGIQKRTFRNIEPKTKNISILIFQVGFRTISGNTVFSPCDNNCIYDAFFNNTFNIKTLFHESSYGLVNINNIDIINKTIRASTFTAICNFFSWKDMTIQNYTDIIKNYTIVIFNLPLSAGSGTCTWLGLAYIGCVGSPDCFIWLRTSNPYVAVHEIGHTLGLNHASTDYNNDGIIDDNGETSDYGSPMGNSIFIQSFSGIDKIILKWFPTNRILIHNSKDETIFYIKSISEDYINDNDTYIIKIDIDTDIPYYLTFRTNTSYDVNLYDDWKNAIYIHRNPDIETKTQTQTLLIKKLNLDFNNDFRDSKNNIYIKFLNYDEETAYIYFSKCKNLEPNIFWSPDNIYIQNTNINCIPTKFNFRVSQMSVPNCNNITIRIIPDNYPDEISFELYDLETLILNGNVGTYSINYCSSLNTILSALFIDNGKDGFCCFDGRGSYTIFINDKIIASGGKFGYIEQQNFYNAPQEISNNISQFEIYTPDINPFLIDKIESFFVTDLNSKLVTKYIVNQTNINPIVSPYNTIYFSNSATRTVSKTRTFTFSNSPSKSSSNSLSSSPSITNSKSPMSTNSRSFTPSISRSSSTTNSRTSSISKSPSTTNSRSFTSSISRSKTTTNSRTSSISKSPSTTNSRSFTPSISRSKTSSLSRTWSMSLSRTWSLSATRSKSITPNLSKTKTPSISRTWSLSASRSKSITPNLSKTKTPSITSS